MRSHALHATPISLLMAEHGRGFNVRAGVATWPKAKRRQIG
jgi:hypothetical protein